MIRIKVNLQKKMESIKKPWTPVDVAKVNDQVVRIALFKGEYHWHAHKEDELFYVLKGAITIQIRNGKEIKLTEGEIATVPRGIEHCPKSEKGAYVLMFEPSVLKSRGD